MATDILFEITRIGSAVRVTAVDPQTGTEAVIQGPASASPHELQRVAANKLRHILDKQAKA